MNSRFLVATILFTSCSSVGHLKDRSEQDENLVTESALRFGLLKLAEYPNPPEAFCLARGHSKVLAMGTWTSQEVRHIADIEPLPQSFTDSLGIAAMSFERCTSSLGTMEREFRLDGKRAAMLRVSDVEWRFGRGPQILVEYVLGSLHAWGEICTASMTPSGSWRIDECALTWIS